MGTERTVYLAVDNEGKYLVKNKYPRYTKVIDEATLFDSLDELLDEIKGKEYKEGLVKTPIKAIDVKVTITINKEITL